MLTTANPGAVNMSSLVMQDCASMQVWMHFGRPHGAGQDPAGHCACMDADAAGASSEIAVCCALSAWCRLALLCCS